VTISGMFRHATFRIHCTWWFIINLI
jgi:hypothetical protein